jgi:hypothetical protein
MAFLDSLEISPVVVSDHKPELTQKTKITPQSEVKKIPEVKVNNDQPDRVEAVPETGPNQQPLTVLQSWKDVLERVRDVNPATQGILNSCTPLGIKENKLILSFPSDLLKEKMEGNDHLKTTQDAIEKIIGVKLPVVCIVGSKDQSELPEGVDPDGLVAAVVRDLGGSYVSDQENQ